MLKALYNLQKRYHLWRVRRELMNLGYDMNHLTDEELETSMIRAGEMFSKFGLSVAEMSDILNKLSIAQKAIQEEEK